MRYRTYFLSLCLLILCSAVTFQNAIAEPKRPLKMMYTEWKPFIYVDNEGHPQGFNIDIIRTLIEEKLGRDLIFEKAPWKRVQQNVALGQADMFSAIPTAERRKTYLIGKQSLFDVTSPIYTYQDHPKLEAIRQIKTLKDIQELNLSAISVNGNGWHEKNIEAADIPTIKINHAHNLYRMLQAERGDIIIDLTTQAISQQHLKTPPLPGIIHTGVVFSHTKAHLIFSKLSDHQINMDALDAALSEMHATGVIQKIFNDTLNFH